MLWQLCMDVLSCDVWFCAANIRLFFELGKGKCKKMQNEAFFWGLVNAVLLFRVERVKVKGLKFKV